MHVHNFVIDLIHTNIQIYVGIIKNNEQIKTNDQTDARLLWLEEERLKANSVHLSKITRLLYNVSLTEVRLDYMKWNHNN